MRSTTTTLEAVRKHALQLLSSIGVSRIIVVDDEYAGRNPGVEELIGICSELAPSQAVELPHLGSIDFAAGRHIWTNFVRDRWEDLDRAQRQELMNQAFKAESSESEPETNNGIDVAHGHVDTRAAESLEEILNALEECEYITLSLNEWKARANTLLTDDIAANTVLLFDRDFSGEEDGTEDEGFNLVRRGQKTNVGYCGMITHTVPQGGEYDAWCKLAVDHNLVKDTFVVIAKERLTSDPPDYYGFLGMLRLVALSSRCAQVKSAAWGVFAESVDSAKAAVDNFTVFDFDRIVFGSSRREGVWEPETLFRVFAIHVRREARARLYEDAQTCAAFADARRVSAMPEEVADALRTEIPSSEALRIQRFESYESEVDINKFHVPIELGDIFEVLSNRKRYILLAQPCDLMVRESGVRGYEDDKLGRTGALVELVINPAQNKRKESWGELPYYYEESGSSAFVDFAKTHQVRLAVLDLCALNANGVASLEVDAPCPELLIEPWKSRYPRLQKLFRAALNRYGNLGKKQLCDSIKSLALPSPSSTLRFQVTTDDSSIKYLIKRVMRLRQPWCGALLTAFTQFQARAAFEHPFEHRTRTDVEANRGQDNYHGEELG